MNEIRPIFKLMPKSTRFLSLNCQEVLLQSKTCPETDRFLLKGERVKSEIIALLRLRLTRKQLKRKKTARKLNLVIVKKTKRDFLINRIHSIRSYMDVLLIRLKALVLINFSSRQSRQSSVILTPYFPLHRIA